MKRKLCERKIRAQKKEVFPSRKKEKRKNTVRRKEQKEFERGREGTMFLSRERRVRKREVDGSGV